MRNSRELDWQSRAAPMLVVVTSCAAAFLVYRCVILPSGPLGADESAHALNGLTIAQDLRQHDWFGVLYDTYRQVYWPPLNSWLTGFVFLFTRASDVSARLVSALCLVLLPPLLFLAERRMSPQQGPAGGLIAAWLAITSPTVIFYSSLCMLEMPGLVAETSTLLVYFYLSTEGTPPRRYMLLGLGLLACYFTKTNYGILLGMALAVAELTAPWTGLRNLVGRRHFYVALPICLVLAVWFAYPAKLQETWETLSRPYGGIKTFGVSGLLYYPQGFVLQSGSIWMSAAFLAYLIAGLWHWRDARVRVLVVLVALQFFIGELHPNKTWRHLLPVYPALFLLAGYFGAKLWNSMRLSGRFVQRWAPRLVVSIVLLHAGTLPWSVSPRPDLTGGVMLNQVASVLRPPGNGLAVGTWDAWWPSALDWLLITRYGVLDAPQAGSMAQLGQTYRLAGSLNRAKVPGWVESPMSRLLARHDEAGKSSTVYLSDLSPLSVSVLAKSLARPGLNSVVIVTSTGENASLTASRIDPFLHAASFQPVSAWLYKDDRLSPLLAGDVPDTGFRLDIYRKTDIAQ